MPVKRLKDLLETEHIKYVQISHSPAYTAQEIAATAHIHGKEMAKTVMVRIDGKIAMAVLAASAQVDFNRLLQALGARQVELASEEEFKGICPDCEVGAMPPFGPLYGVDLYLEHALTQDEEIYFNAGSHRELLKMAVKDYMALMKPRILSFAR